MPQIRDGEMVVIYGTQSGILRLKILALPNEIVNFELPPGTSWLLIPRGGAADDNACRIAIAAATGKPPLAADDARCALVDDTTDVVVNTIMADPAIDTVHGHSLIAHKEVGIGDKRQGNTFTRRYAIARHSDGVIVNIVELPLAARPNPNAQQFAVQDLTHNVGDVIPVPSPHG